MKPSFSLPAFLKITAVKSGFSCQKGNSVSSGDKIVSALPEFQLVSFTDMPEALWVTTAVIKPSLLQLKYMWLINTGRTKKPLIKQVRSVLTKERGNWPC